MTYNDTVSRIIDIMHHYCNPVIIKNYIILKKYINKLKTFTRDEIEQIINNNSKKTTKIGKRER